MKAQALLVDPRGQYPNLLGAEPGPIVAHLPCNLWANLAAVSLALDPSDFT